MTTRATTTRRPARGPTGATAAAVAAEWTKLWSLRSTYLLCLAALALMAVATYQVAANYAPNSAPPGGTEISRPSTSAVVVVLLVVVSLTMTTVTSEYATGSIRTTLLGVPQRRRLLLAKTIVVTATSLLLGLSLTAVGTGVTAATITAPTRFEPAAAATTTVTIAAYLAVASMFTLGLALTFRTAVGTLSAAAIILLGVPAALGESVSPGGAGLAFLTGAATDPNTVTHLLAFIAWAIISLTAGWWQLVGRDPSPS